MKTAVVLIYDGSFEGFLTCVFTAFEQQLTISGINVEGIAAPQLFAVTEEITTDDQKAERVKNGLITSSASAFKELYWAFLSEFPGIEMQMLGYICYIFQQKNKANKDYSHPDILKISQTAKMVSREKHRMEAFVRFKLTKDDIFFAEIEPDFNVLPIILPHFESRFADQKWLIYDKKRRFGLFYDLHNTRFIHFENYEFDNNPSAEDNIFKGKEAEYQKLWQNYFTSTNIASRKNMDLHLKHVPKRYWKYLSEKRPLQN